MHDQMPNTRMQQHLEHDTLYYVDLFVCHNAMPMKESLIKLNILTNNV